MKKLSEFRAICAMSPVESSGPKLDGLRAQGTLNPRPEGVRDPAFRESDFFNPQDLIQVKYEMLRRVLVEGDSVADATASFGVSRPTFYKAQSAFARDGLAGLLPGKRGPRGPHKLTPQVIGFVARALAKEPTLDAATLAQRIEHELGVRIHRSTAHRAQLLARRELGEE